jgi:hypothetical protein
MLARVRLCAPPECRIKIIGDAQTAGAGHVLHDDTGLPWNMPAQKTRKHARIKIVAPADAVSDQHGERAAGIEIRGAGRTRFLRQRQNENDCRRKFATNAQRCEHCHGYSRM